MEKNFKYKLFTTYPQRKIHGINNTLHCMPTKGEIRSCQERREWCEQTAREFLANNPRPKYYYTEYIVDAKSYEAYIRWSDEDKAAILQQIEADKANYPSYGSNQRTLFFMSDLDLDYSSYFQGLYGGRHVDLKDVNFDDYICCEQVVVARFPLRDGGGKQFTFRYSGDGLFYPYDYYKPVATVSAVQLTDEEFVKVLTEMLYAIKPISFTGLCLLLPEIGQKIMRQCDCTHDGAAIFLEELNAIASNIIGGAMGGIENTPAYLNIS